MGLAIGMAAFIIIMLWVKDELSYDKYNVNAGRIYRMNYFMRYNGDEGTIVVLPGSSCGSINKRLS